MAVLPCLPRGHRRDFSPKREKSADPHAQSSHPINLDEFSHGLQEICVRRFRSAIGGFGEIAANANRPSEGVTGVSRLELLRSYKNHPPSPMVLSSFGHPVASFSSALQPSGERELFSYVHSSLRRVCATIIASSTFDWSATVVSTTQKPFNFSIKLRCRLSFILSRSLIL